MIGLEELINARIENPPLLRDSRACSGASPIRLLVPIAARPDKAADAAVVSQRQVFDLCAFGEVGIRARPPAVKMPVPRAGRHNVAGFPTFQLVGEPNFAVRSGLEPRAEMVGITGGEIAEVFPAQINRDASPSTVGKADEGVGIRHVTRFQVIGVAAGITGSVPAWIYQV